MIWRKDCKRGAFFHPMFLRCASWKGMDSCSHSTIDVWKRFDAPV
jgi:hypothetical protein